MAQISAGLLLYRRRPHGLEVLLVHPGGPYWRNKDEGAWSIPKGEIGAGEEPLAAAKREFEEELGFEPKGQFIPLPPVRQKAGKTIHAWAFEGVLPLPPGEGWGEGELRTTYLESQNPFSS
jgi:predicted NUDIX family NTP pyrophosphohydrolase